MEVETKINGYTFYLICLKKENVLDFAVSNERTMYMHKLKITNPVNTFKWISIPNLKPITDEKGLLMMFRNLLSTAIIGTLDYENFCIKINIPRESEKAKHLFNRSRNLGNELAQVIKPENWVPFLRYLTKNGLSNERLNKI